LVLQGSGAIAHRLRALAMGTVHRLEVIRHNHSSHHPLKDQCLRYWL
jgi:hypothetical protein